MKSAELRSKFLSYFEARGHTVVPSTSLIPPGDPTLMFVNAGMVPFKDVFLGKETRSYSRATSCQRCLRVSGKHNDLEEVGPSPRHHTFFEMLGNFSFGDYFKEEAIAFAWEFLTKELGLKPDALHPTIFEEDDESAGLWEKIAGIPSSQVVRLGAADNFWSMGDTGPCGPNSEIMYDRTGTCLKDGSDCPLTCDCDRWWELWNLVFMQYDRSADGTLTPLSKVGVDTGMGLDRLTSIMQGVETNYDNDLFAPLIEEVESITGTKHGAASQDQRAAMRILADHARATAFLIVDGIRPSNEGRGYVLRRIMRRAIYYGRSRLIWNVDYLERLVRRVGGLMSEAYPELHRQAATLTEVVSREEVQFLETLGRGRSAVLGLGSFAQHLHRTLREAAENPQARFNWASSPRPLAGLSHSSELPEALKGPFLRPYEEILGKEPWNAPLEALQQAATLQPTLNGETIFLLWDTYGVPREVVAEAAAESGLAVDEEGFERALEEQRERGRAALGQERGQDEALLAAARDLEATRFVGYDSLAGEGKVLALFTSSGRATEAREGEDVQLVLDASPFYAEGGGQVGDSGRIAGANGEVAIENVRRIGHGVFVHSGRVVKGRIAVGEAVRAEVDETARRNTMRNHTATHLLHKALRVVLGPQAKQAGSLVAPDRLRFDFYHSKPLTDRELRETERIVRLEVLLNRAVQVDVMPLQEALSTNADAMFDEKYGEEARVVSMGGNGEALPPFSRELCGGTHCHRTGEVGAFFIVEQRSVGAGVRRVEAVTGLAAYDWMDARRKVIDELAREYNVPVAELPDRIRALQERAKDAPKAAASNLPDPQEVIDRAESFRGKDNGALLIIDKVDAADAESLRQFGDELRKRAKSAAVVLGSVVDGKPSVIVMLTANQVKAGLHAGKLAQQIGKKMGAGGGGRPDVATAGGRDASGLDAGLALARELLGGAA